MSSVWVIFLWVYLALGGATGLLLWLSFKDVYHSSNDDDPKCQEFREQIEDFEERTGMDRKTQVVLAVLTWPRVWFHMRQRG